MALLGGQFALGGANGALLSWDTVADIVTDAATQLGLIFDPVADPYASTDPNIRQLTALLKPTGRGLVRERGWTHLQKETTIQTVANQDTYSLPSDFREMIDQSGWNRTTVYQVGGPIGAAVWQYTKAVTIVNSVVPLIRFDGGQLKITPVPKVPQTIAFEYISWFWVKGFGEPLPSADVPSLANDVICFNSDLVVCALKLAWKKSKGFDTTTDQADYDRALASEMNADAASPEITLGGGGDTKPAGWGKSPLLGVGQ